MPITSSVKELRLEFQASMNYTERTCLKTNNNLYISVGFWWCWFLFLLCILERYLPRLAWTLYAVQARLKSFTLLPQLRVLWSVLPWVVNSLIGCTEWIFYTVPCSPGKHWLTELYRYFNCWPISFLKYQISCSSILPRVSSEKYWETVRCLVINTCFPNFPLNL